MSASGSRAGDETLYEQLLQQVAELVDASAAESVDKGVDAGAEGGIVGVFSGSQNLLDFFTPVETQLLSTLGLLEEAEALEAFGRKGGRYRSSPRIRSILLLQNDN